MMNFFIKKGKREKKVLDEVKNILDQTDMLQKLLYDRNLPKAKFALEQVVRKLDNPDKKLTVEQIDKIKRRLEYIEKHAEKPYEERIKEKCEIIDNIVLGIETNEENENNVDKCTEMQADLVKIEEEMNQIKFKKDLVTNEYERRNLEANYEKLEDKRMVSKHAFERFLLHLKSINKVSVINKSKAEADYIEAQPIDVEAAKNNAMDSAFISQEVISDYNELNKILNDNFGFPFENCLFEQVQVNRGSVESDLAMALKENLDALSSEFSNLEATFATKEEINKTIRKALSANASLDNPIEALLARAETRVDFEMIAGTIYSSIEGGMIPDKRLNYKNRNFVMNYSDYITYAEKIHYTTKTKLGIEREIYPCKFFDAEIKTLVLKDPKVITCDSDDKPILIEMPPVIRFYILGLSCENAAKAAEYWRINHYFRHHSPESIKTVEEKYPTVEDKRMFFKEIISFFKKNNLYNDAGAKN